MANEDPDYIAWLGRQKCCVEGCHEWSGPPHHARQWVGAGRRAHDHRAVPMCHKHHHDLHSMRGHFKGGMQSVIRGWLNQKIEHYRDEYLRRRAADGIIPF